MLKKVISGGQTGADRIGLEVAKTLGIPTGGTAPRGWKTEAGPDPLLKSFGLQESVSSDYNKRTAENVINSDGTVLFGNMSSPGSVSTLRVLVEEERPYIKNPSIEELVKFIRDNNITTLNVAGNRGSKLSIAQFKDITHVLREALSRVIS